jgi:hypothetical protein
VLQVCGWSPLHCCAPGVHAPVHAPLTHAWLTHVAGLLQTPIALHVSTPLLEHWVAPGAQVPVHPPLTHAWLTHETGLLHAPPALQVSTPSPEHWVAVGVQAAQAPLTHAGVAPEHADAAPQLPFTSQLCTPLPEHCVAPGVHCPVQAPALHTY